MSVGNVALCVAEECVSGGNSGQVSVWIQLLMAQPLAKPNTPARAIAECASLMSSRKVARWHSMGLETRGRVSTRTEPGSGSMERGPRGMPSSPDRPCLQQALEGELTLVFHTIQAANPPPTNRCTKL